MKRTAGRGADGASSWRTALVMPGGAAGTEGQPTAWLNNSQRGGQAASVSERSDPPAAGVYSALGLHLHLGFILRNQRLRIVSAFDSKLENRLRSGEIVPCCMQSAEKRDPESSSFSRLSFFLLFFMCPSLSELQAVMNQVTIRGSHHLPGKWRLGLGGRTGFHRLAPHL